MIRSWLVAAAMLGMTVACGRAQNTGPGGVTGTQLFSSTASTVITSRGPTLVTGNTGSMASTMIPGSPLAGSLMNNGNGSSLLFIPGRPPEAVITPR